MKQPGEHGKDGRISTEDNMGEATRRTEKEKRTCT